MLNELYFALDPIAFWIGPFAIRWYGLGYIVGIIVGGLLVLRIARRWNIRLSVDALLTLYIVAVLGIIIGGRVGYIFFYGAGYYFQNPAEIFAFSNGGMSFHGGVIGMALAILVASRILKMPYVSLADLVVIVAPLGIFLVRCANFVNGELWGAPTDLPWGVEFESGGGVARHPSQLYEALLEGVVLFIVMTILARRRPPFSRGSYLGVFFILYGIFRIAVEFVREPDVQIGYLVGDWLTMGMVLSTPMILIGTAMLVYAIKTRHPQQGLPVSESTSEELSEEQEERELASEVATAEASGERVSEEAHQATEEATPEAASETVSENTDEAMPEVAEKDRLEDKRSATSEKAPKAAPVAEAGDEDNTVHG